MPSIKSPVLLFVVAFCGVLLLGRVQAGVIRDESKTGDITTTANTTTTNTTTANTTTTISTTTVPTLEEEILPGTTVETPRDGADVTLDLVDGGLLVATSRDRDESVKLVAIASVDPVPSSAEDEQDDEVVLLNPDGPAPLMRAAKLLLLSTPKLMERPKEQEEENIEEPEDIMDVETTTAPAEAETTVMPSVESAESSEEQKDGKSMPKVTKLYPINIDAGSEKKAELREAESKKEGEEAKEQEPQEAAKEVVKGEKEDSEAKKEDSEAKKDDPEAKKQDSEGKKTDSEAKKDDSEAKNNDSEAKKYDSEAKLDTSSAESDEKDSDEQQEDAQKQSGAASRSASEVSSLIDDAPAITAQQPNEPINDNSGTAVLIETEADYVLVESDAEEFGSFTHADSDLHLQPIVESVEIVPTHVDDPLIVSYVHHW